MIKLLYRFSNADHNMFRHLYSYLENIKFINVTLLNLELIKSSLNSEHFCENIEIQMPLLSLIFFLTKKHC